MSPERSKSRLAGLALVSALTAVPLAAGVAYLSLPAEAQTAPAPTPPPPPGPQHPGPGMRGMGPDGGWGGRSGHMHDGAWGGRFGHMDGDHRGGNRQMRLAEKLAAVETAIGIRSDQLDAWRDFTAKLMEFATPPWQQGGGKHAGRHANGYPQMKAGNAQGDATPPDVPPGGDNSASFGMLNRMIDGAIRHGQEASQLKDSLQKLEAVLTPQQIQMARTLMRPERGMRMHRGRHDWHRQHMWHGRHDWRGARGWNAQGPDGDRQ